MIQSIIQVAIVNIVIYALEWKALSQTNAVTRWLFISILSLSTFLWIYISVVVDVPRIGNLFERIPL